MASRKAPSKSMKKWLWGGGAVAALALVIWAGLWIKSLVKEVDTLREEKKSLAQDLGTAQAAKLQLEKALAAEAKAKLTAEEAAAKARTAAMKSEADMRKLLGEKPEATPRQASIVPLEKGAPAPFNGMLWDRISSDLASTCLEFAPKEFETLGNCLTDKAGLKLERDRAMKKKGLFKTLAWVQAPFTAYAIYRAFKKQG